MKDIFKPKSIETIKYDHLIKLLMHVKPPSLVIKV